MNLILKEKINYLPLFLILLLPIALVSGPFFSDLIIIILAIFFLYEILIKKVFFSHYNYFFFFLLFSVAIVLISIFSDYKGNSLSASLFYFRFIIFAYSFAFFLIKFENLSEKLLVIFIFFFIFLSSDALFQYFYGAAWNIH